MISRGRCAGRLILPSRWGRSDTLAPQLIFKSGGVVWTFPHRKSSNHKFFGKDLEAFYRSRRKLDLHKTMKRDRKARQP